MRASNKNEHQKGPEQVTVLSNGPIPDVKISPPTVIGETPGVDGMALERSAVDLAEVAPVVADATARNQEREESAEEAPQPKLFRVMATKAILDKASGARTVLKEGKEISDSHYDIRHLQQQGVRLKRIEHEDPTAPLDLE